LAGSQHCAKRSRATDIEGIIPELLAGQLTIPSASWPSTPLSTGPKTSPRHRHEIQARCDIEGESLPDHLQEFVENYRARRRHLSLSLAAGTR